MDKRKNMGNMLTKRKWILIGIAVIALLGGVVVLFGCTYIPTELEKGTPTAHQATPGKYSIEDVARKLHVPTSSINRLEGGILEELFKGYQFFEVYNGGKTTSPRRSVVTFGSDGKPLDFNSLLADAHINIENDREAVKVSEAFIVYFSADGLSGFKFLENASKIPYQKGDFKSPADYTEKVHPPSVNKIDSAFVATLYTWCRDEGILIEWQVSIKDDKVTSLFGEVIDTGIGHFQPRTEGVVHVPGYVISEDFTPTRR